MAGFPTLKSSWPWPWIGSYCIPSCITHRPLPTCKISLKSKKLFVDGRTYTQTDGHLRPTLLGRLCRRVDPKTDYQRRSSVSRCHGKQIIHGITLAVRVWHFVWIFEVVRGMSTGSWWHIWRLSVSRWRSTLPSKVWQLPLTPSTFSFLDIITVQEQQQ